jgi:hypothetical protein
MLTPLGHARLVLHLITRKTRRAGTSIVPLKVDAMADYLYVWGHGLVYPLHSFYSRMIASILFLSSIAHCMKRRDRRIVIDVLCLCVCKCLQLQV